MNEAQLDRIAIEIARKILKKIWAFTGELGLHGTIAYIAQLVSAPENKDKDKDNNNNKSGILQRFMHRINPLRAFNLWETLAHPLNTLSKWLTFSSLEGAKEVYYPELKKNWTESSGPFENLLTPTVALYIKSIAKELQESGVIQFPQEPSLPPAPQPNFLTKLWSGLPTLPHLRGSPVPVAMSVPLPAIMPEIPATVYDKMNYQATIMGTKIAEVIGRSSQYLTNGLKMPSDVIQSIATTSGLPYAAVLAVAVGTSYLALYGLRQSVYSRNSNSNHNHNQNHNQNQNKIELIINNAPNKQPFTSKLRA